MFFLKHLIPSCSPLLLLGNRGVCKNEEAGGIAQCNQIGGRGGEKGFKCQPPVKEGGEGVCLGPSPQPLISLPLFTMFLMQLSPPPPPLPLVGQKPLRISPQLGGGNKGLDAALAYTLFFYASFLFVGWIRGKTVVVTS